MSWLSTLLHGKPPLQYEKHALTCDPSTIPIGATFLTYDWDSLLSRIIGGKTHRGWSHAGTVVGINAQTVEAEANGVILDTLRNGRIGDPTVMIEIWVPVNATPERLACVAAYARGSVGMEYDYDALFGFLLGGEKKPSAREQHQRFCSWLACLANTQGPYPCSANEPFRTTPADIDTYCRAHPEAWTLYGSQNVRA